jgi:hypothetical protein
MHKTLGLTYMTPTDPRAPYVLPGCDLGEKPKCAAYHKELIYMEKIGAG